MNPRYRRIISVIGLFCLTSPLLLAQVQPAAPAKESAHAKRSQAELQAALEQVAPVRIKFVKTGMPIERGDKPVFRHTAPLWGGHHGTVWIWGQRGRPAAVLEMLQVREQRLWFWQFHATTDVPIEMTTASGETWTPHSSNVKFLPLPGAPVPAETPAARLRQMKGIVQNMAAHQLWSWPGGDGARHELRLLATPVHRYEDRAQQLVDGALFIVAQGTNPEATLFLEAVMPVDEAKPIWQFGIGRTSNAEIFVSYGDKEIHHEPAIHPEGALPDTNSYWRTTTKVKEKLDSPTF